MARGWWGRESGSGMKQEASLLPHRLDPPSWIKLWVAQIWEEGEFRLYDELKLDM